MSEATYELKLWWTPQIPMQAFETPISSIAEGQKLLSVLGAYDLFQLEHNIKPDFCNAGGLCYRHPTHTEGEWWDVPDDEDEWADELQRMTVNPTQEPQQ